jgi:hypothetical protein
MPEMGVDKFKLWRGVIEDPRLDAHEKAVAFILIWHMNTLTRRCDPSYATVQRETALSRTSVSEAIMRLQGHGVLRSTPRPGRPSSYDFSQPEGSSCSLLCSGPPRGRVPIRHADGSGPFHDNLPSLDTAIQEADHARKALSRVVRPKTTP